MRKLLLIGGGSLLLVLSIMFGAFFAGPLLASAHTGQTTASSTNTATNPYCEQYLQDLANRLHVSVSTLQQARLGAREDVLAQLVKDGKLTQAQADAIKQKLESHQACTGNRGDRFELNVIRQTLKKYVPDAESQIAQGLHLSASQLQADLKQGQSLEQIATAQHVSNSQLHTIVTNAIQNVVNKAVSAGDLTQQQGAAFTQFLRQHPGVINLLLNRHFGKKA